MKASDTGIRLEIEWLKLNRPKTRWNLYFIFATEHPKRDDQIAVTVLPGEGMVVIRKLSQNFVKFIPQGTDSEGLAVIARTMPGDFSVQGQLWVVHSRDDNRKTGDIVKEISRQLAGSSILGSSLKLFADGNLWLGVTKDLVKGMGSLGRILIGIKDRHLGYVNMGEHFDTEEKADQLKRQGILSTGYGEIAWKWEIYLLKKANK